MTSAQIHERLDHMKSILISMKGRMPMSVAFKLKKLDQIVTEAIGEVARWQYYDEEEQSDIQKG